MHLMFAVIRGRRRLALLQLPRWSLPFSGIHLRRLTIGPDFSFLPDFRIRIWDGFLLTIGVSAAAMVLSLLLGILSAAAKLSRVLLLRDLSSLYVVFIRGTPLIMQIYLFSIW